MSALTKSWKEILQILCLSGIHEANGSPSTHEPSIHEPFTHEPSTHELFTHQPFTHEPFTHEPFTHEPLTQTTTEAIERNASWWSNKLEKVM